MHEKLHGQILLESFEPHLQVHSHSSVWCVGPHADADDISAGLCSLHQHSLRPKPQIASSSTEEQQVNTPQQRQRAAREDGFIDLSGRQNSWSVWCLLGIRWEKLGVALHMRSAKCGLDSQVLGCLATAEADCCIDFT